MILLCCVSSRCCTEVPLTRFGYMVVALGNSFWSEVCGRGVLLVLCSDILIRYRVGSSDHPCFFNFPKTHLIKKKKPKKTKIRCNKLDPAETPANSTEMFPAYFSTLRENLEVDHLPFSGTVWVQQNCPQNTSQLK